MNVIIQPDQRIMSEIGPQYKTEGKTYRLLKYIVEAEYNGFILMYNHMTKALIQLTKEEREKLLEFNNEIEEFLIRSYFKVTEAFNEVAVVEELRSRNKKILTDVWLDHPSAFTILPTTTCNARCFYCYENPMKKQPMRIETAKKVIEYIKKVAPTKDIGIGWFGGEPTFNMKVIDMISQELADAGFNIRGSMISNGYLFDDEIVKKAKELWKLNNIQITIDGTEEIYNKTKNYIYKTDESAYRRVVENMKRLVAAEIRVSVRMNVGAHNYEDLKKVIIELDKEIGYGPYFGMYVHELFEQNGFTRTPEERQEVFQKMEEMEDLLTSLGYDLGTGLNPTIKGQHCMVDSGNSVTINPDGSLGNCEHYIDSFGWSHIDNPLEKNWDVLKSWFNETNKTEICKDCPIRPTCYKVHGCPDEDICDEPMKHYKIEKEKKLLIRLYQQEMNARNKQNNNYSNGYCVEWVNPECPKQVVSIYNNGQVIERPSGKVLREAWDKQSCSCKPKEEQTCECQKQEESKEETKKSLWTKVKSWF